MANCQSCDLSAPQTGRRLPSTNFPCPSFTRLLLDPLTSMFRFTVLIGLVNHVSKDRLLSTCIYVVLHQPWSDTVIFALGERFWSQSSPFCANGARQIKSFLSSLIRAVAQVEALVSYVLAYFRAGESCRPFPSLLFAEALSGVLMLRFGGQLALSDARSLLPTRDLATGDSEEMIRYHYSVMQYVVGQMRK